MIELGPGADLFRMVGGFFWLLVIGALLAALFVPKTRKKKIIALSIVISLFLAFPGRWAWDMKRQADAARERLDKAEAMFQEHCKRAGEKIYRTAENVEGILLMKIRPNEENFGEQFKMDDPYGAGMQGDWYIKQFFSSFYKAPEPPPSGWEPRLGYQFVEVIDPQDGNRYRYTGRLDQPWLRDKRYGEWVRDFVLDKIPSPGPAPRYGVTFDDISTREDREYWIAGSSLRIIDLETNEVVAERIGYMMDRGQGALGTGGTHPAWSRAMRHACPAFPKNRDGRPFHDAQTQTFVAKILKPKLEN